MSPLDLIFNGNFGILNNLQKEKLFFVGCAVIQSYFKMNKLSKWVVKFPNFSEEISVFPLELLLPEAEEVLRLFTEVKAEIPKCRNTLLQVRVKHSKMLPTVT